MFFGSGVIAHVRYLLPVYFFIARQAIAVKTEHHVLYVQRCCISAQILPAAPIILRVSSFSHLRTEFHTAGAKGPSQRAECSVELASKDFFSSELNNHWLPNSNVRNTASMHAEHIAL